MADPNNPNLYSYCGNSPVMRVDPSGKWWWLVGAILGGLDSYLCGGDFMQGFVMGAVTGAIGAGVNTFVSSVWGNTFGSQTVSGAIAGGITGELSGEGFKKGAVYGAVAGAISYGVDKRYGEYASKSTYNKVVINGLKGGLNGLARGGDFIEGFAYGFAYGYAYEYGSTYFDSPDYSSVNYVESVEKPVDDRYVLTIYVDQPGEGGDDDIFEISWDKTGNVMGDYIDVGHTWVSLTDKQIGVTTEAGLGLDSDAHTVKNAPGHIWGGGKWDVKKEYILTKKQYDNAFAKIERDKNDPKLIYDLKKRNCTDWVKEVAKVAGQKVPDTKGKWYFRADNPGQFGEELMKQGGVRNN